jgi:hypothetical protein
VPHAGGPGGRARGSGCDRRASGRDLGTTNRAWAAASLSLPVNLRGRGRWAETPSPAAP